MLISFWRNYCAGVTKKGNHFVKTQGFMKKVMVFCFSFPGFFPVSVKYHRSRNTTFDDLWSICPGISAPWEQAGNFSVTSWELCQNRNFSQTRIYISGKSFNWLINTTEKLLLRVRKLFTSVVGRDSDFLTAPQIIRQACKHRGPYKQRDCMYVRIIKKCVEILKRSYIVNLFRVLNVPV